jgi:hypothetical protein
MVRPLNTNKSSPRSRGGGSPICWQNCWQKQSLNLQADEIPRRPKGSVGMTNGGGGARIRGWFGHSTRTSHPPAPAGAGAQFVGRIVGRIVGRSNPSTYKRMRFLVARWACVGMTSGGEGARTRGWFGHSTRTNHPPAPAAAGAQFVGRIVGRSNPSNYKRMRFLVARRALSE